MCWDGGGDELARNKLDDGTMVTEKIYAHGWAPWKYIAPSFVDFVFGLSKIYALRLMCRYRSRSPTTMKERVSW